ncbi:SubName: Full=Uncharacterized protein {ECO:0000313/EMBL:CCA68597.1} [Serendipita indica DSM 11827]|nr:SubName: Full=Uncharacterized protein {ECO:0000313/EMBL:CCA68597.1} [Serendipita indica DSM 11827]
MTATFQIPRRQRALVDSCFEESLYNVGLGMLDRLRAPDVRPSPQHVRQLLFLALYPVGTRRKEESPSTTSNKRRGVQRTTSEMSSPTQEIVGMALDILYHFLHTNEAHDLLCAIPSYDNPLEYDGNSVVGNPLAYHASTITQVKSCWELVSPGFIGTESYEIKGRCRLVGEASWPVLEWMIHAFEKDGTAHGGPSPMLASQLPNPGFGPRLVMDGPLDIIASTFEEPLEERKVAMGTSLLRSLISLTRASPQLLSSDRLVGGTERRLGSMSATGFLTLFAGLTDFGFKLAIACAYIVTQSGGSTGHRQHTTKARKPPKPRVKGEPIEDGGRSGQTRASVYAPPTADRMMEILRLPARVEEDDNEEGQADRGPNTVDQSYKHGLAKVQALGAIDELGMIGEDEGWIKAVKSGRLEESIRAGFAVGDGSEKESMAAVQQTAATYTPMTIVWDAPTVGGDARHEETTIWAEDVTGPRPNEH